MNLEEDYLVAYYQLIESLENYSPRFQEVISLIDMTLLDEAASEKELQTLCEKANHHHVAAVCVLPEHLQKVSVLGGIKLATVVNFPEGSQTTKEVLKAIDTILTNNPIDEIDYVFPHQAYMAGEKQLALSQCKQAYELCQQQSKTFKVILETGALPSLEFIYNLCSDVIHCGCDFLKTSTGKIAQGATLASAFTILKAIKDNNVQCGLKVSGGIKKPKQAFSYMALARLTLGLELDSSWFRIGASSLLDKLVNH
ncbi:MAG: deoxyribose-phosphate aldolase [Tatlockia sp.]|nr:deoxyribose-phosphate aldolase [Tatlockia sp.]